MNPTVETAIWMALRQRVEALPLELPIAWPGEVFEPGSAAYLAVQNIVARPARALMSAGPHDRTGTLQIMTMHPIGTRYEVTQEAAGQIAEHFPCDLRLTFGGVSVRVTEAPHVSDGYREDAYWQTPVRVRWQAWA